jgi:transposase-like protein
MPACPYCSSSDLSRDGHNQRGRAVRACRACGRHATSESMSLVAGHRFPRDVILLAPRYYLQLGAAAERIAGLLADSGVDEDGQVLDCWLSPSRDLAGAEAFFRRAINSTGCTPEHVVTDKATFYPSAIRTYATGAKHTATGFYNLVISTNRCERNHGYVKSRVRPMRGLKSFKCAAHLFRSLDALQLVERDFMRVPPIGAPCTGGRTYVRACHIAAMITRLGRTL